VFLALSRDLDAKAAEFLSRLGEVEFTTGAPQSVIVTEDDVVPVHVELVDASAIDERLDRTVNGKQLFLLVNAVLDDETAAKLEDAGIGYIAADGRRWLRNWERTQRVSRQVSAIRRSLRAPSVRLAQLLADYPLGTWTERRLAERAHTTQATAHRLLARIESEGLIEREGRGRGTTRCVRDVRGVRAWLARNARPGSVVSLSCFVPDPFAPAQTVGRKLALTGAVAAEKLGLPVLTHSSLPIMRVSVQADELEDVPEALGGFRTEAGPNLLLVADPDRLAFVDARSVGGLLMAPPSRMMLDLYLEPRGEAAVDVFLALWGEGAFGA